MNFSIRTRIYLECRECGATIDEIDVRAAMRLAEAHVCDERACLHGFAVEHAFRSPFGVEGRCIGPFRTRDEWCRLGMMPTTRG